MGEKTCRKSGSVQMLSRFKALTVTRPWFPHWQMPADSTFSSIFFAGACILSERSSREWAKSRWMFTTCRSKSWRRRTTAATGKEDSPIETGWLTSRAVDHPGLLTKFGQQIRWLVLVTNFPLVLLVVAICGNLAAFFIGFKIHSQARRPRRSQARSLKELGQM